MAFHWRAPAILSALEASPDSTTTVGLEEGDATWDPTTVGGLIWGPATVEYQQYVDGGIVASVTRP